MKQRVWFLEFFLEGGQVFVISSPKRLVKRPGEIRNEICRGPKGVFGALRIAEMGETNSRVHFDH